MAAARELRYSSRSAVYGDLAYDLDLEAREHALRHAGEAPRHQAAEVPQVKTRPRVRSLTKAEVRQRQKVSVLSVLGVGAAIGLAVLVLMGYIQLTALSAQVVDLQEELAQLETENVSLTAQHEKMFDLATVKEVAEAAGMSKPSSSQIYYLDMTTPDSASVYEPGSGNVLESVFSVLGERVYAVVEYFTRIWSKKGTAQHTHIESCNRKE